ncbi:glycoside hydrolase family 19 protein [Mesorhizobium sp.]|uniref:glycoside hydrolase family 19 protein n=1 Tax=Mesorhizobium sp. TaxID=1871066 RepID=UPI00257994AB|nr:glycoside hydrolase family 19 protein [Mesorhizobium sp.]
MLVQLKAFAPGGSPALLKAIAAADLDRAGIDTPLRLCHFMAQMYVESGGFRSVEENLRYSAKRLTQVWPNRFPTLASAQPFANNPQALANKVYGGRMGNTGPNDGWLYRGRGPKQITGKDNYRQLGRMIGVDLVKDPDALLDPAIGIRAAIAFWSKNGCNKPADRNDIRAVTKIINGGYNGLADRRAAFRRAVAIWGEDDISEIGAKGASTSNIGKASLAAGGLGTLGVVGQAAEIVPQMAYTLESGGSIADLIGIPLITLVLFVAVVGLVVYIFRDRLFIARHEGL